MKALRLLNGALPGAQVRRVRPSAGMPNKPRTRQQPGIYLAPIRILREFMTEEVNESQLVSDHFKIVIPIVYVGCGKTGCHISRLSNSNPLRPSRQSEAIIYMPSKQHVVAEDS